MSADPKMVPDTAAVSLDALWERVCAGSGKPLETVEPIEHGYVGACPVCNSIWALTTPLDPLPDHPDQPVRLLVEEVRCLRAVGQAARGELGAQHQLLAALQIAAEKGWL